MLEGEVSASTLSAALMKVPAETGGVELPSRRRHMEQRTWVNVVGCIGTGPGGTRIKTLFRRATHVLSSMMSHKMWRDTLSAASVEVVWGGVQGRRGTPGVQPSAG